MVSVLAWLPLALDRCRPLLLCRKQVHYGHVFLICKLSFFLFFRLLLLIIKDYQRESKDSIVLIM